MYGLLKFTNAQELIYLKAIQPFVDEEPEPRQSPSVPSSAARE
jgi:hypothetical protein